MKDPAAAQRYLDAIAAKSPAVKALLTLSGATGETLSPYVDVRDYALGDVIIREGSQPTELYLVLEGESKVAIMAPGAMVNRLLALDVAGEVSMVTKLPAISTVTADEPVKVLVLPHTAFSDLLASSPGTGFALLRAFAENVVEKIIRTDSAGTPMGPGRDGTPKEDPTGMYANNAGIEDHLKGMAAFRWKAEEITPEVTRLFRTRHVPAGDRFILDGEPSDSLYLLVVGTARVDALDSPIRAFVGGHSQCEHVVIGELSFLTGRARTGTVMAVTDCELLEFSSARMVELVQGSPAFAGRFLLGILGAVCRKLADTSANRARYTAVIQGDWDKWFVEEADFSAKFGR